MSAVISLRIKKYLERKGRVTLHQLENYCAKGKVGVYSDFHSILKRMEDEGTILRKKQMGYMFYSLA